MRTSYQPSAGPSRTGPIQMGRFQPYGMSRVRPSEHRNAEAGPSTLVVPPAPYLSLPTLEPSGGISETTADAENKQTTTEEDKIPVSNFYCSHILHVIEWLFGVRVPSGRSSPEARARSAAIASGPRKMLPSCAAGPSGGRGSQKSRALTWL